MMDKIHAQHPLTLMSHWFSQGTVVRALKMLDIALVGNMYLFLGLAFGMAVNALFTWLQFHVLSTITDLPFLMLYTAVIMLIVYIMRLIVKQTSVPWDGYRGYDRSKVKELKGAVILAFVIITQQQNYKALMQRVAGGLSDVTNGDFTIFTDGNSRGFGAGAIFGTLLLVSSFAFSFYRRRNNVETQD